MVRVIVRLGNSAGAGLWFLAPVRTLGVQLDPIAEDRIAFFLEPVNPSQRRVVLSAGSLVEHSRRLRDLRGQVLEPTRSSFDALARGLVEELNRFHQAGMGLDKQVGRKLFSLKPTIS